MDAKRFVEVALVKVALVTVAFVAVRFVNSAVAALSRVAKRFVDVAEPNVAVVACLIYYLLHPKYKKNCLHILSCTRGGT